MQRIIVTGISGSGKSTLARRLARRLSLPYVELDALHHGPGWVKRAEFEADVAAFAAGDRWVTEDQYTRFIGDLLWRGADTLVWLDYDRPLVLARVLRRTLRRAMLRTELWNGNREPIVGWIRDPEHPVRWAWSQHEPRRQRVRDRIARHPDLRVLHFSQPSQTRAWLSDVAPDRQP